MTNPVTTEKLPKVRPVLKLLNLCAKSEARKLLSDAAVLIYAAYFPKGDPYDN